MIDLFDGPENTNKELDFTIEGDLVQKGTATIFSGLTCVSPFIQTYAMLH